MSHTGKLSATTRDANEANTKFDWFIRNSMQLLLDLFGFIIVFNYLMRKVWSIYFDGSPKYFLYNNLKQM
jgi:hypothetical protein